MSERRPPGLRSQEQGRVRTVIDEIFQGHHIKIENGRFFCTGWDFGLVKGVHVNAELRNGGNKTIVDPPDNRNSVLFHQVIVKYSNTLGYRMKPNTDSEVFYAGPADCGKLRLHQILWRRSLLRYSTLRGFKMWMIYSRTSL